MIDGLSFINSVGEYAYDCTNRNDMLLRDVYTNNTMIITTEHDNIVVTKDTKIMMDNGMYMYASLLHVGDCLKHYTMNKSVITGVTFLKDEMYMLKVVDCEKGYLIVNNFFVASSC